MIIYNKSDNLLICHGLSNREFRCKCKHEECRATFVNELLIRSYERFRIEVAVPLHISSGYRCPRHNASKAVGGAARSRHPSGEAVDIGFATLKDKYDFMEVIALLKDSGFTYVQWYADLEFFHCDVRPIYNQ